MFEQVYLHPFPQSRLLLVLDAALQGELTPLSGGGLRAVSIVLVVLGDLRFLLLLSWLRRSRPNLGSWLAVPVGWSFFVPIASFSVARPIGAGQPRVLFLVYEAMFASMALALLAPAIGANGGRRHRSGLPPTALAQRAVLRWLHGVCLVGGSSRGPLVLARGLALALIALVACGQGDGAPNAETTASVAAGAPLPEPDAELSFSLRGKAVRSLTKRELAGSVTPEPVRGYDPYYKADKTFLALPIAEVLKQGFAGENVSFASTHYVLRASDGYTVPMTGEQLVGDGAYLAVADADVPGWAPIGTQRAHPGPYYLVWKDHPSLESHPRPWQLTGIEVARFEDVFPRTAPAGLAATDPAQRGYATFRKRCIKCHAINQQGGLVGPELNIPQNITEYRPEEQIRAYIRNPQRFRYSKMPAAPDLSEAQLDELIAYLEAMKERKQDPKAKQP